jgi:hypothetical protein
MKISEINATRDELMTLLSKPSTSGPSAVVAEVPLAHSAGGGGAVDGTEPPSPFVNTLAAGAAVVGFTNSQLVEELLHQTDGVVDLGVTAVQRLVPTTDAHLATAIAMREDLPLLEQGLADQAEETLHQIVYGADAHGRNAAAENTHPELQELARAMATDINNLEEEARRAGYEPINDTARALQGMQTLGAWGNPLRNEGTSTASRLLGNLASVGVRAGVSTFVATAVRNIASFALQQAVNASRAQAQNGTASNSTAFNSTASPTSSAGGPQPWSSQSAETLINAVGGIAIGTMVVLQLAGAIRDQLNGRGTVSSNALRVGATAMAASAIANASNAGAWGFPMASFATTVGVYSLLRGPIAAALPYRDNLTALPGATLAAATVSYAAAQGAGNFVQNAAGFNAGATAAPRSTATSPMSPAEILNTPQPWGANIGHSTLNAALEMFDDLQFMGTARALNAKNVQQAVRALGPDMTAQMRAAALQGMLQAASQDPGINEAGLLAAATAGVRQFKNTQIEGLRMSMARAPVTEAQVRNCATAAVNMLAQLGYTFDRQAEEGSPAMGNNRMIAAFVAQQLRSMEMNQPLEMVAQVSSTDGLRRLGARMTDQMLTVEPLRQAALNSVFGSLITMDQSVPATTPNANLINNATESALVAGNIASVYPVFYGAVIARGEANGSAEAAAQRQQMLNQIMDPPPPTNIANTRL